MPYGSGTLFKRGRIWWMQWWDSGTRHQRSTGTTDRREALAELQRVTQTVSRGGRVRTVAEAIGLLYADYARRELRSAYITRQRIEANVLPWWGKLAITKLTPRHVDDYAAFRRSEGAKNSTINREVALVRRALTLAVQAGKLATVPFLRALPEPEARKGFIEQEQYERLKREMPDHIRGLLVLGYHTGMRKGELLALRWDQVDWDAGLIRLDAGQTKAKRSRAVPIYGEMAEALRGMQALSRQVASNEQHKVVLATMSGRIFPLSDFRDSWAKACAAAGLPGLLFHDLRRSAVRNMERAGIPRSVAMAISGHSTESVYRRYDIVSEADLLEAGKKLEGRNKK